MQFIYGKLPFILICLLVFVCPQAVAAQTLSGPGHTPLLDGGIWRLNPGTLQKYSDEQLAEQVERMHGLGLRVLVIQSTVIDEHVADGTRRFGMIDYTAYPIHPAFEGRNPLGTIFLTADRLKMRVYLGGLPFGTPEQSTYAAEIEKWSSAEALGYRKALIKRYAGYASFTGFYIPIMPDPYHLVSNRCDPAALLTAADRVSLAVKSAKPDLEVLMPIGLHLRATGAGNYLRASRHELNQFWRPWVERLEHVDTWMMIDGLGDQTSDLDHAAMAQRWLRDLTHTFGKRCWTGVQTRGTMLGDDATAEGRLYTLGDLVRSLAVASRFADQVMAVDYLDSLSPVPDRPGAAELHAAYAQYTRAFKHKPADRALTAAAPATLSDQIDPRP